MTKLEEEIALAIDPLLKSLPNGLKALDELPDTNEVKMQVKATAEVCKDYIDRAVKNLIDRNTTGHQLGEILKKQYQIDYENWLKSEGITE